MNDIEIIKNGQIYERDPVPGVPECATVGARLEKNFINLIQLIESDAKGDIEVAAEYLK